MSCGCSLAGALRTGTFISQQAKGLLGIGLDRGRPIWTIPHLILQDIYLYVRSFGILEGSFQLLPSHPLLPGQQGWPCGGCPGQTAPSSHPWPVLSHALEHHILQDVVGHARKR